MNKLFTIILVLALLAPMSALALEEVLEGQVNGVTTALDKNGDEYVRLIVQFDRTLNGEPYSVPLPVMAFSSNPTALADAKLVTEGQTIKAIVQKSLYNGRESYSIVKFIK